MTIGWAIAEAVASGRSEVYVADGLYEETVTLVDGISLRGGFTANTWQSHIDIKHVVFTDPNLKAAVVAELGVSDPATSDIISSIEPNASAVTERIAV